MGKRSQFQEDGLPGGVSWRVALVVGFLFLWWPPSAEAQDLEHRSLVTKLDTLFASWDATRSPGMAVAAVRGDSVAIARGYGMADLERGLRVTENSIFDLASVSKHFTGLAIARLATEGLLDLDADIRTYLPDYPDLGHTVTPRHLVHNTSGVRDWVELIWLSGWRFDDVISMDDIWNLAVDQKRLNFAPGDESAYSNTGFNLLTMIVEEVVGLPFDEYLRIEFFGPAGMRNTTVQTDHLTVVQGRTGSYEPRPDGAGFQRLTNNTSGVGSSSVLSSAEDMLLWLLYMNRMEAAHTEEAQLFQTRGVLSSGDTLSYAFGINVGEFGGHRALSHGGSWRGYRSHILHLPEHEVGVFVVSNSTEFSSASAAQSVAQLLLPDVSLSSDPSSTSRDRAGENMSDSPVDTTWASGRKADFTGVFWSEELRIHMAIEEGRSGGLVLTHRIHGQTELAPDQNDTFTLDGIRGTQTLHFARDSDGSVEGFSLDGARFRGVDFQRVGDAGR